MNWRKRAAAAVAVTVVLALPSTVTHANYDRESKSGSSQSKQEARILDKSEQVFRTILPSAGALRLWVDMVTIQERGGHPVRFWTVDCANEQGDDVAHVGWDGATGQFSWVSVHEAATAPPATPSLTEKKIIQLARSYIYKLGMASKGQSWKLMSSPELEGSAWRVHCGQGKRRAIISVDALSGKLITARMHTV
jgi:hypothetical protein